MSMTPAVFVRFWPTEGIHEFVSEQCRINGRPICPRSVGGGPDVTRIIEIEADLRTWHFSPWLPKEPSEWPINTYRAVQHARSEIARMHNEYVESMTAKHQGE